MHHLYLTIASAIYVTSAVIGFVISVIALPHYVYTYRRTAAVPTRDRLSAKLVNGGVVVTECVRLTIHILTLSVGVESIWIAPAAATAPVDSLHRLFGEGIVAVLLWANIGTTINSAIVYAQYRILRSKRVRAQLRED